MPLAPVRAVALPIESKLNPLYKSAYFADAFAVTLPASRSREYTPDALARALLCNPPSWFSTLMWIRDRVMSVFGVKRSTEMQAAAENAGVETIAVFPVISRAHDEIVVGENDRHLDFRTSILVRDSQLSAAGDRDRNGGGMEMVAITVVHCHGLLGKVYITVIRAFHVLIIKYSLARVLDRITASDHYTQKRR